MKVLLLSLAALLVSSGATADNIGVYADCTGMSCAIAASGFSSTTAVVHKYSQGTTLSRWKIVPPASSNVFSFTPSAGFNAIGGPTTDIAIAYGQCMAGSFCVGTFVAIWGVGTIDMTAADLQASLLMVDCQFNEKSASDSDACVAPSSSCCEPATEQSTWGNVKALYR